MAFNPAPKITLTHIDTYDYESVNESGNKVHIDMHDPDKKKAQSPTELLLTAVASCSAVDVVEILGKRKKQFSDFTVVAKGKRREQHPRYFEEIDLIFTLSSNEVTVEELEKNAKLIVEKYCSVAATVSGIAKLNVVAVVNQPS